MFVASPGLSTFRSLLRHSSGWNMCSLSIQSMGKRRQCQRAATFGRQKPPIHSPARRLDRKIRGRSFLCLSPPTIRNLRLLPLRRPGRTETHRRDAPSDQGRERLEGPATPFSSTKCGVCRRSISYVNLSLARLGARGVAPTLVSVRAAGTRVLSPPHYSQSGVEKEGVAREVRANLERAPLKREKRERREKKKRRRFFENCRTLVSLEQLMLPLILPPPRLVAAPATAPSLVRPRSTAKTLRQRLRIDPSRSRLTDSSKRTKESFFLLGVRSRWPRPPLLLRRRRPLLSTRPLPRPRPTRPSP